MKKRYIGPDKLGYSYRIQMVSIEELQRSNLVAYIIIALILPAVNSKGVLAYTITAGSP